MRKAFLAGMMFTIAGFCVLNAQVYKTVHVDTAGTLLAMLSGEEIASVTDLTVTGNINADDFLAMKTMMPVLTGIDLGLVQAAGDSIPQYAFNANITSLILPSTTTLLGDHALEGCSMLTSLMLPPSVTSVGYSAFAWCSGLTSLIIPDAVNEIRDNTFMHCSGLTSVILPESLTSIGNWAFAACSGLPSIKLPDSLRSFGMQAFVACSAMHTITIPDRVTSLGYQAFAGCSWLDSIALGSSLKTIGTYAFAGCINLKSITIPPSVDSIAPQAFVSCQSLTSVVIQSSGEITIGEYAFAGDPALESITIYPSGGTSIGKYAFVSCTKLQTLEMASPSVTSIGEGAFINNGITALIFPSSLVSVGKMAFLNSDSLETVTFLPSSRISIGELAFYGCSNLDSLTFYESSGTSIGPRAFQDCTSLVSLKMSSPSVDTIGYAGFHGCTDLTSLTIPNSLVYIGEIAFQNGNISGSLTMPSTLTYIGKFAFSSCQGIDSLTFLPTAGTTIDERAFYNCDGLISVRMYSPSVDTIGWGGFDDSENMTHLYLPASLSLLSPGAFGRCYALRQVRINCLIPPVALESNSVFNYVSTAGVDLYVPAGTREAYQAAEVWRQFNIIEYDLYLSVTPDTLAIIDTAGIKYRIDVRSSSNWQVTADQQWLGVSSDIGMDTACIILSAETNPAAVSRSARIIISGENVVSDTVFVIQAPGPVLSVSAGALNLGAMAGSNTTFTIASNQAWTIQCDQPWLSPGMVSGNGNAEISLMAEANPDTTAREATVTVYTDRLSPQTIEVIQSPALFLSVSADSLHIEAAGSSAGFNIASNTEWTLSSDQQWLTAGPLTGVLHGVIELTAEPNQDTLERIAFITVEADGVSSQTIVVIQGASIPSGLATSSDEMIRVFPNPLADILHIKGAADLELFISDLQGRIVLTGKLYSDHETIDLSFLKKGNYMLRIGGQTMKMIK